MNIYINFLTKYMVSQELYLSREVMPNHIKNCKVVSINVKHFQTFKLQGMRSEFLDYHVYLNFLGLLSMELYKRCRISNKGVKRFLIIFPPSMRLCFIKHGKKPISILKSFMPKQWCIK